MKIRFAFYCVIFQITLQAESLQTADRWGQGHWIIPLFITSSVVYSGRPAVGVSCGWWSQLVQCWIQVVRIGCHRWRFSHNLSLWNPQLLVVVYMLFLWKVNLLRVDTVLLVSPTKLHLPATSWMSTPRIIFLVAYSNDYNDNSAQLRSNRERNF